MASNGNDSSSLFGLFVLLGSCMRAITVGQVAMATGHGMPNGRTGGDDQSFGGRALGLCHSTEEERLVGILHSSERRKRRIVVV